MWFGNFAFREIHKFSNTSGINSSTLPKGLFASGVINMACCPAHLQPLVVTGTYLWRLWWEWQRRRRKVCPNPSPRPQLNGYPALPCPRAVSGSQCLRKGRWQNARPTSLRENIADVGCFLGKLVRLVKYIVQWNRKLIIAFPLLLLLIMQLLNY